MKCKKCKKNIQLGTYKQNKGYCPACVPVKKKGVKRAKTKKRK